MMRRKKVSRKEKKRADRKLRDIAVRVENTCRVCGGSGISDFSWRVSRCKACKGSGQVRPKPIRK